MLKPSLTPEKRRGTEGEGERERERERERGELYCLRTLDANHFL